MNSRERVKLSIKHREPDRLPRYDSLWEDTIANWLEDGAGELITQNNTILSHSGDTDINLSLQDAFKYDINLMFLDNSFRLDAELINNDGNKITVRDRCGYTADKFIGKSRTLHMYDHVTKDREAWDNFKTRLTVDVDKLSRIDDAPFFMRYEPCPTWNGAAKRFNAVYSRGRYTMMSSYGPVEAAWRHRGYTEYLMDTVLDESLMDEMAELHTNLIIETMKKGFVFSTIRGRISPVLPCRRMSATPK